jgi:hypothetical protein
LIRPQHRQLSVAASDCNRIAAKITVLQKTSRRSAAATSSPGRGHRRTLLSKSIRALHVEGRQGLITATIEGCWPIPRHPRTGSALDQRPEVDRLPAASAARIMGSKRSVRQSVMRVLKT